MTNIRMRRILHMMKAYYHMLLCGAGLGLFDATDDIPRYVGPKYILVPITSHRLTSLATSTKASHVVSLCLSPVHYCQDSIDYIATCLFLK
jgi:hypothetical protein